MGSQRNTTEATEHTQALTVSASLEALYGSMCLIGKDPDAGKD